MWIWRGVTYWVLFWILNLISDGFKHAQTLFVCFNAKIINSPPPYSYRGPEGIEDFNHSTDTPDTLQLKRLLGLGRCTKGIWKGDEMKTLSETYRAGNLDERIMKRRWSKTPTTQLENHNTPKKRCCLICGVLAHFSTLGKNNLGGWVKNNPTLLILHGCFRK